MIIRDKVQPWSGLLMIFFNEKEYISSEEFREFCSPTVLLARIPKFTYWDDEPFTASIEVAHYGKSPIHHAKVTYVIKDQYGKIYDKGLVSTKDIQLGNANLLGVFLLIRQKDFHRRK